MTNIRINGAALIGGCEHRGVDTFRAYDPRTGEALEPPFTASRHNEVELACSVAEAAFASFSSIHREERAAFLEAIAVEIGVIGDALIERTMRETGLPRERVQGEMGRTVGQLRLFAEEVRDGGWIEATVDNALPERIPVPRRDLRRQHVGIGPVAVFGSSNFPLAFSVAGGDTAAALAAGCPVIVKGHPAHPGTGELVARAVQAAARRSGMHAGVFSFLPGNSNALGTMLVADPRVKAVGFTGSRSGGLTLMQIAAHRDVPIPVFAEMSSVNPVIIFPAALMRRRGELAEQFIHSLTLGVGQFCTCPGVVVAIAGPELNQFTKQARGELEGWAAQPMLTAAIHQNYERDLDALANHPAVQTVGRGRMTMGENSGRGALFYTDGRAFLSNQALRNEIFGPAAVIVGVRDLTEMADVLEKLEGQLTATVMVEPDDYQLAAEMLPFIQKKAGRILANDWPTGVEVTHAMVHGGPFPSTSDGVSTSVGTMSIKRFLRPVSYQNFPSELLPRPLREVELVTLPRRVDGQRMEPSK